MLVKSGYFVIGICCLILGVIGAFLPVMPTTVFILIAAWAFANSSDKFHQALLDNSKTGPMIRSWRYNQCVPKPAKIAALVSMIISLIIVWFSTEGWMISSIVGVIFILILSFILTRPSNGLESKSE